VLLALVGSVPDCRANSYYILVYLSRCGVPHCLLGPALVFSQFRVGFH